MPASGDSNRPNALQTALAHHEAGRLAEAEVLYRQLLAADANDADAMHLLGVIALQRGDSAAAATLIERAIALNPSHAVYHNNLGEAYRELDRAGDAATAYQRAIALNAQYAEAWNNLGNALKALGRHDEAERSYRRALELNPALARASVNLALLQLLRGDFAGGLACYEDRYAGADALQIGKARAMLAQFGDTPRWQGEALDGKTLLVWTEQGFGDSLMMARYLPLLKARGVAELMVCCEAPLARLMQAMPAVDDVLVHDAALRLDEIDFHCPLMSLPFLFETRIDNIPAALPYLEVPVALQRHWSDRLKRLARPRVGLVWVGGQRSAREARRSIRFETLAPLFAIEEVSFVSLQKGVGAAAPLFDAMDECDDFLDTAAQVLQLDLVISVDTAVAHLAAALGRPVWLLNRSDGVWQWLLEREDSPWYPGMRLFRQGHHGDGGDWGEVVTRVAAALKQWSVGAGSAKKNGWPRWLPKLGK